MSLRPKYFTRTLNVLGDDEFLLKCNMKYLPTRGGDTQSGTKFPRLKYWCM